MANLYEFVWSAYTPVRVMPLLRGGPLAFFIIHYTGPRFLTVMQLQQSAVWVNSKHYVNNLQQNKTMFHCNFFIRLV